MSTTISLSLVCPLCLFSINLSFPELTLTHQAETDSHGQWKDPLNWTKICANFCNKWMQVQCPISMFHMHPQCAKICLRTQGPNTEKKHRILLKNMISSIFVKWKWEKARLIKHWKEYILFYPYPIFRNALPYLIGGLQTVAFGNWHFSTLICGKCLHHVGW